MISEQDKQQIINGAFGVTREGYKAKLVFTSTKNDKDSRYLFAITTDFGEHSIWVNENLKEVSYRDSPEDIIGLWQDKQEPFNLEKALAGEPVMLRNGSKAYVKFVMPSEYKGKYPLNGYITNPYSSDVLDPEQWTMEGKEYNDGNPYDYDIISMWKDPELVSNTVTLTLPCPLKEPQNNMWFIGGDGVAMKSDYQKDIPTRTFNKDKFDNGFYFGSKEDVQAWLDALKNNRR